MQGDAENQLWNAKSVEQEQHNAVVFLYFFVKHIRVRSLNTKLGANLARCTHAQYSQ